MTKNKKRTAALAFAGLALGGGSLATATPASAIPVPCQSDDPSTLPIGITEHDQEGCQELD